MLFEKSFIAKFVHLIMSKGRLLQTPFTFVETNGKRRFKVINLSSGGGFFRGVLFWLFMRFFAMLAFVAHSVGIYF